MSCHEGAGLQQPVDADRRPQGNPSYHWELLSAENLPDLKVNLSKSLAVMLLMSEESK